MLKKLFTPVILVILFTTLSFFAYSAEPVEVEFDDIRVQLLSETLVRIEVKGPNGFEDRPSFTVSGRDCWKVIDYTVASGDGYNVIATSAYDVYIPQGAKNLDGCYITDISGNILWKYIANTTSNVYLPSPSDELKNWCFTDSPRIIPSENGYSVTGEYTENNGWDFSNDSTDMFVFLPNGNYTTFTTDFVTLTGRSEMISLKLLGYWDSRWYAYTAETALQQIRDYLDRGYSIDVLVIDTDWRNSASTGYTVNEELFPDMATFLEDAHELGVDIVFNDHPEPATDTDNLLDEEEIEYRSTNLKLILSLGLDYWWYDRNWSVSLNPIHKDISIYTTGMYAFNFVTEEYYESIADINEYARRALLMANVDGIKNGVLKYAPELASHRYTLQWTGDIGTNSEALKLEIFNAVYGGAKLGLPYVSADIGGHAGGVSNSMYTRWMQFGALSPIMRVHCTRPYSRMPWEFGETAEAVTHTYVDMRYRMLPIYYSLAHENYETGLPIVRRLDIAYPEYIESAANDQYLIGDTILVAPIAEDISETTSAYTLSSNGNSGLLAEYYGNKSLSGNPVVTEYTSDISFDYSKGEHPLLKIDNYFSARYSGEITIGENDCVLSFFADDGLRVWIDGDLVIDLWDVYDVLESTDVLKAGSTHTIKIEYFEGVNYSYLHMTTELDHVVSRDVFLPSGEWMDVWTGERFAGPKTITVSHGLETSPIFVRMGAVLPLADNMFNTDEKDWSHITLDVYPSITNGASFTLYEDDTETVAYKEGLFRESEITLSGSGNSVTLSLGAAEGSFEGEKAFETRDYTVRVHGRDDWGELVFANLDGSPIGFTTIAKDENAAPLAAVGGARDNIVYELSFTADIYAASELVLTFASTANDAENLNYDATEAVINTSIETLDKASTSVNLSAHGNKDWVFFNAFATGDNIRKNQKNHLIGELVSASENGNVYDNYTISWQDGDLRERGSTTNSVYTKAGYDVSLRVSPEHTHYQLYLGGYKSLAQLTVRDRAGNVQTYTVGDMKTNYYNMVSIDCHAETETEIYISYTVLSGDNITFSAITASDGTVENLPEVDLNTNVGVTVKTPYTDVFDLTYSGYLDWEFYGKLNRNDTVFEYRKADAADRIATSFGNGNFHYDNKATVTWSDGGTVESASTLSGMNVPRNIAVTLDTRGAAKAYLLVGAWKATNKLTVFDKYGIPLSNTVTVVSADSTSQLALVCIDLSGYSGDGVVLKFEFSGSGNISLSAVALTATLGDIDKDGTLTLQDVLMLLTEIVNEKRITETHDVNKDTKVSLLDVLTVFKSIIE